MEPAIDRRELLAGLLPDPGRYLLIAGLAGAAKDSAAYTKEADNLLTLGGAMGGAVAMALGVALSVPDQEVLVLTGDGDLLMNAGVLATVASAGPGNLSIVCVDNGQHGETGGQPGHTSRRTDLAKLADGAGIPSVSTLASPEGYPEARKFLDEAPGPRFLLARVMPGPPADYRRNWNLAEGRLRFRNAWLARGSRG